MAFGISGKVKIAEALIGGFALAWLMACLLSWIIQVLPSEWFAMLSSPTTAIASLLIFLGFCSFFAVSLTRALRDGNWGLYTVTSFTAFWVAFLLLSSIYSIYTLTQFFFNNSIICLLQIMITYVVSIFTLSDIGAITLRKADPYIIGIIPFMTLIFFLILDFLIPVEMKTHFAMEPTLWIFSLLFAVVIGYIGHFYSSD
jgi:hypothetical protein